MLHSKALFSSYILIFIAHCTRTMQDNLCSCYLCFQKSCGLHHPESTPVNSPDSIDTTPMSFYTNAPVNLDEWPSAVAPIMGATDSSLFALPGTAENIYRVAHESYHQIALGRAPPLPLARCNYSTDALLQPSCSVVEDETAYAYASQTAWYEGGVTLTRLDGNQVPSETTGLDAIGKSWSRHDDACQAAVALAQPTSLYGADYPPHLVPAGIHMAMFPEISASLTSQVHMAGSGNASSRMAGAGLGHVASPVNRRRYHRKPHARPERVVCDTCKKKMRRQSLKRHIREVHDHVKRPHARSGFAAGS